MFKMVKKNNTPFLRNNENLKVANYTEHITKEEFQYRVNEIAKCKADILYFANKYYSIVDLNIGKHVIKLYPKQQEMLQFMCKNTRSVILASRRSGKTVSYSIYALWYTIFNNDKKVLICAQSAENCKEFLAQIKLSFEDIPNWLKPGVIEWNKRKVVFANLSSITAAVTSSSVRGLAANILILDEFAFIPNNIADEFWSAVMPVVSSSPTASIIMVSTPNGLGNLYYSTYKNAVDNPNGEWKSFKMEWHDVPGRDEKWKQQTIDSLCRGDLKAWHTEYGNQFFGSSYTLLSSTSLESLPSTISNNFTEFKFKNDMSASIWKKPQRNHCYIIGGDVSEGVGGDSSVAIVLDVTNPLNVEVVSTFKNNYISPVDFAYVLVTLCKMYNQATLALECNSIGKSTLDTVFNNFEYDNIVNLRKPNSYAKGILSNFQIKFAACMWIRDYTAATETKLILNDSKLLEELRVFERLSDSDKPIFKAVSGEHDDLVMSLIWALYILNESVVEKYFEVVEWFETTTKLKIPKKLVSYYSAYFDPNAMESINDSMYKKELLPQIETPKQTSPDNEGKSLGFFNF